MNTSKTTSDYLVRDYWYKIITFIIVSLCNAYSQSEIFNFEQITIQDGLSHNSVHCILQDKHGFIWFGTPNGLTRFDGYHFQPISQLTNHEEGQDVRFIHCLLEDKQGNIWIGTEKSGLYVLNRKKGKVEHLLNHPTLAPITGAWITEIYEDDQSNIWIATLGQGFLIAKSDLSSAVHFTSTNSDLNSNQVMDFATDQNGDVWIATSGVGLNRYSKDSKKLSSFHAPSGTGDFAGFRKVFYFDYAKHTLWIGTEGSGLYTLNTDDLQVSQYEIAQDNQRLNHERVRDIKPYSDSLLLIATDGGGLNVLNTNSNQFIHFYSKGNAIGHLNTNAILHLLVDSDSNIWLGTFNGGVNVFKSAKTWLNSFKNRGGIMDLLTDNSILSISEASPGEIFFATDGSGLAKVNLTSSESILFQMDRPDDYRIKSNVVKTLFKGSEDRLFLGFFNAGLDILDPNDQSDQTRRQLDSLIPENCNVWAFEQDADGSIWIGTLGYGLYHFDPITQTSKLYRSGEEPHSLSDDHIMCLLRDAIGNIWAGTADGGLNLFQPETQNFKIYRHDSKDSLTISSDAIRSLYEDTRGYLWIGTEGGGLNVMETMGAFRRYDEQHGLLAEDVMAISEDEFGHIWFSTHKNIARLNYNLQEVTNFYSKGEHINQFNQNSVLRASNQLIYFGGIKGVTYIDPANVKINKIEPNVVFTAFEINNETVFPESREVNAIEQFIEDSPEITLQPDDDVFSIEFSALDYTDPINIEYKYIMKGFDDNWTVVSSEYRKVTYTNLSPGSYEFMVKSTNSAGKWSTNTAVLKVTIRPSFWQTNWFKTLLFLAIVTLAILVSRIVLIRREFMLKQRILSAEGEVLKLTNEKLESEISNKNARLMSTTLQMAHKNEILGKIKKQLENIPGDGGEKVYPKLRSISRSIDTELRNEDFWDQFNFFFNQVNANYLTRLKAEHSSLTQNDIKLCALIKTGMSTKEIASVLNITGRGVEKSRYRLKKKLGLATELNLNGYLSQI